MMIEKPHALFATDELEFIPSPKRVRARFGGAFVADTTRPVLMREKGYRPVYYFPAEDIRQKFLTPSDHETYCSSKGTARYWNIRVGENTAENAAWAYPDPPDEAAELAGYIAFEWSAIDAWFEEDEQVFVHPRDPYHRIDVRQSSRHVRIILNGETIAETRRPTLLFETGLPTRYYIPQVDVELDALAPSDKRTGCPYKGEADYYHVILDERRYEDIAWVYRTPLPGALRIAGHLCFFQEKVNELIVDGEVQQRPDTQWS